MYLFTQTLKCVSCCRRNKFDVYFKKTQGLHETLAQRRIISVTPASLFCVIFKSTCFFRPILFPSFSCYFSRFVWSPSSFYLPFEIQDKDRLLITLSISFSTYIYCNSVLFSSFNSCIRAIKSLLLKIKSCTKLTCHLK